jgi:hypothetical protein
MPGNPLTDPNWAADTTDTVVRVVGTVRERTTTPAVHAARAVVFGILAAFLGLFALVLFMVGLQRGLEALWDLGVSEEQAVYLSHLTLGGILCIVGLLLFSRRRNAG